MDRSSELPGHAVTFDPGLRPLKGSFFGGAAMINHGCDLCVGAAESHFINPAG